MAVPTLNFSNGYSIPVIGLGTWKSKPTEVTQAVEVALDAGYRHIDCAFVYMNEEEVGAAIKNKINEGVIKRKDIFITSKLWNTYHRPDLVEQACRGSLERLGLDYLDLYLVHWPTAFQEGCDLMPKDESGIMLLSDVDYLDTWAEMEKCVDLGLVRSVGLSNFNSQQIDCVLERARIKPVNLQVECHSYFTQSKLREFCKERDIVVTAYSPLGSPDSPYLKPDTPRLLEDTTLSEIANGLSKSVAQVALRYLVQLGTVVIPKSVTAARIYDNINIFDFELSDGDMSTIDSLHRDLRTCPFEESNHHKDYPFNVEFCTKCYNISGTSGVMPREENIYSESIFLLLNMNVNARLKLNVLIVCYELI